METILKFITNTKDSEAGVASGKNYVISRTLCKIAVISKFVLDAKSRETLPAPGEMWRCRIVKETQPGQNAGCFIVEPIVKIDENDIVKLVPGTFSTTLVDKKLIVRPKEEYAGSSWIISLHHKRILVAEHKAYALIVDLDSEAVTTDSAPALKIHG